MQPDSDARTRADIEPEHLVWFESATDYLRSAHLLYEHSGSSQVTAGFLYRAVRHHLKGWLVLQGTDDKAHDLNALLRLASKIDTEFNAYSGFGNEISRYKLEKNYPGLSAEAPSRDKIRELIETGERVIGILNERDIQ